MSEETKFGLDDLVVGDDLDVSLDNDTYQDQANPAPPVAGNYRLRALSLDYRKNKAGETVLDGGQFPIFVIGMAEIVEGLVDANGQPTTRKVGLFADVKTKSYDRYGTPASGLGDLTRSYGTPNWRGLQEGINVLKEAFESNALFTAQLDWSVYDKDLPIAAFEQLGITPGVASKDRSEEERKIVNAIYKEARVVGMKNFPFNENTGKFVHVLQRENVDIKLPSGTVTIEMDHRALEARPTITRYFPAVEFAAGRVKLGPSKVKTPAAVAA